MSPIKTIHIPFGDKMIESLPVEKTYIEDLKNSPSNQTLIDILNVVCQEIDAELKIALTNDGDEAYLKAKRLCGYLHGVNDVIELLSRGLKEALANDHE
jgi:hypothetical protein